MRTLVRSSLLLGVVNPSTRENFPYWFKARLRRAVPARLPAQCPVAALLPAAVRPPSAAGGPRRERARRAAAPTLPSSPSEVELKTVLPPSLRSVALGKIAAADQRAQGS